MRIMPPLEINDTRLVSSDIPEPDAAQGEFVWVSGQAYTTGTIVIRVETHRKYIALANVTSTTAPENDPANWLDVGPTNRYAMFDYEKNTATVGDASAGLTFVINPQKRIGSVTVFGVVADELVVTHIRNSDDFVLNTYTFDLFGRNTTTWFEYLTGEFEYENVAIVNNLAQVFDSRIELTFTRANGDFSVETVAIGSPVFVGDAEYGANSDILDFSRIERDEFGSATLVRRKNVPTINASLFVSKPIVPKVVALRREYQATPLVFLGLDDSTDPYFEALSGVGIIKSMPVVVEYPNHSVINLEVEGL